MSRFAVALLLLLSACASAGETTTTSSAPPQPTLTVAPTTTAPPLEFEVHNCAAPPVTFSALCDVYELIQDWHVDRPIADTYLAEIAVEALLDYSSEETEEAPRKLLCAVPTEAFTGLCAQLARLVDESSVAVGPAVEVAVTAMADIGLDPFTYYVPPEQVGSFRFNGVVGGIGVLLDATDAVGSKCTLITEACPLTIVFVLEDNPAAAAGLAAGDEIIAVDGVHVDGQGFAATVSRLAGDETGSVVVTFSRSGAIDEVRIQRAELTVPTVTVDLPIPDVGYLRIPDFEEDIPQLVGEALTSLADFSPETIVIDLRDNPGGLIDAAVAVASEFIDGGVVLRSTGPGEDLEYSAAVGGLATTERLIVLINEGSASAAEIVAGALREEREAFLLGSPSFGKDAVQIPFELRNGGEFYVAVARWSTPEGVSVGGGGLTPDAQLLLDPEMTNEEIVQAALDATP